METQTASLDLKWLYSQGQLKLREILPTTSTFDVIQISELVDPTDFISPNSVVLSVGIAFADTPENLRAWAHRLATAGVIAIGFGSGLTFPQVPQTLIDASRHLGLGLFEVPREIPFISITSAVRDEQTRRAGRLQQELLLEQERLNSIAISGGIDALCRYTAEFLHGAVAIVDSDGRVASSTTTDSLDAVPQTHNRILGSSQAFTEGNTYGLIHRMTRYGDRHHVLSVQMSTKPTDQHRALIRHCAGLADILLQRPEAMRHREIEVKSLAISLLLGRTDDPATIHKVFADITDASGNIRPIIITGNTPQPVKKALSQVAAALYKQERALAHLKLDDSTELLFLRGSRSVENIGQLFGPATTGIRLCVGLPTPVEKIDKKLIRELTTTAKSLPLGTHAEPRDASLLWLNNPELRRILKSRSRDTYDRLLNHDHTNHTELAPTLVAFTQHGGHIGDTAKELGIHRHTVRTRMTRIEEICEINLHDPLTRAELLLVIATKEVGVEKPKEKTPCLKHGAQRREEAYASPA